MITQYKQIKIFCGNLNPIKKRMSTTRFVNSSVKAGIVQLVIDSIRKKFLYIEL